METLKKSSEINIRGTVYFYTLSAEPDKLSLTFEEKETGKRWKGDYSSAYIETLTQKSKSFKKYLVFVKMLSSALDLLSESVVLDLLTYQELEMFRSSRNPGQSEPKPELLSKRYIILTFSGEFERVHYPLPLTFEEVPDQEALKKTVARLTSELAQARKVIGVDFDPVKLLKENEDLKQQVLKYEHNQVLSALPRKGAVEIDTLIRERKALELENERLRIEGTKDVKKVRKENDELQQELDRVKKEMDLIINQLEKEAGGKAEINEINSKVMLLTQQLDKVQRQEAKAKRELDQAKEELEGLKETDKKQKLRIKQLEEELQASLKARGVARTSSPATRVNARVVSNAATKSPNNTRSPRVSNRLGTPPGSRENSRGSSRPGSDRIGVRYSPASRTRSSPNRGSPSNSFGRKNASPVSRLKTPPSKASPVRRNSPQASPQGAGGRTQANKPSEIDSKLKKLSELIQHVRKD